VERPQKKRKERSVEAKKAREKLGGYQNYTQTKGTRVFDEVRGGSSETPPKKSITFGKPREKNFFGLRGKDGGHEEPRDGRGGRPGATIS